jgi:hypothetical protein
MKILVSVYAYDHDYEDRLGDYRRYILPRWAILDFTAPARRESLRRLRDLAKAASLLFQRDARGLSAGGGVALSIAERDIATFVAEQDEDELAGVYEALTGQEVPPDLDVDEMLAAISKDSALRERGWHLLPSDQDHLPLSLDNTAWNRDMEGDDKSKRQLTISNDGIEILHVEAGQGVALRAVVPLEAVEWILEGST